MLDYRIETFLTLCRERNYSKTAQELCITQPAVTQHIQYLERLYDTKLFEYENKQLTLTKQGKILQQTALGMRASNKRVFELIQESMHKRRHFKIGASLTLSECVLPPIIANLHQYEPELRITVHVDTQENLLKGLQSGKLDCLLVEGAYNKEDYIHCPFSTEDFIAISGKPMHINSIADLLKETLICRGPESKPYQILEDILLSNNHNIEDFKNIITLNNVTILKELVKQQVGIAFMFKAVVMNELNSNKVFEIPLDTKLQQEFNFVILKNTMFEEDYLQFYEYAKRIYEAKKAKEV